MKTLDFKEWIKKGDYLFWIVGAIIYVKSMLFLALLHGENSATLNIKRMYFSKSPIMSHVFFLVIFMIIGFLFWGRGRSRYYITLNALFSMLLWLDLIYFRVYGSFLSFSYVLNKGTFNPAGRNLFSYVYIVDIFFFIDLLFFAYLFFYNKISYKNRFKNLKKNVVTTIVVIAISVSYIWYDHYRIDVKDATNGEMIFFRTCWAPFQTMSNMSPLGYHIYDFGRQFTEMKNDKLTSKDKEELDKWFKDNKESIENSSLKGVFKDKNIIFLQIESLENFVVGEKVNGQEITPNLNKMLKNSLYFSNIYEQVNNGTSSDGDMISLNSIYPVREKTTVFRFPNNTYNSIAKIMKSEGYKTISTHPENSGNWNWRDMHKAYGFDKSYDVRDYNVTELIGPGISDGQLFEQFFKKVENENKPFFAQVVTLTSHGPFDLDKQYKDLKLDEKFDNSILGAYFQSVNYVDRQIGNLVKLLEDKNMMKDTALVIYGDHAGPHKFYQDRLKDIDCENPKWKEKDIRVPLIIYNPSITGEKREVIGGQMDIMPTVLYLAGVDESKFENTAMGKILVKTNRNFTILNNGEIVGMPSNEKEKEHIEKVFYIGDKLLKTNYIKYVEK